VGPAQQAVTVVVVLRAMAVLGYNIQYQEQQPIMLVVVAVFILVQLRAKVV
jgi:hypothetical protein